MNDFAEQDRLISLILAIWLKNPNLRLCQLIGNCFTRCGCYDLYFIEDDVLQDKLINTYLKEEIQ